MFEMQPPINETLPDKNVTPSAIKHMWKQATSCKMKAKHFKTQVFLLRMVASNEMMASFLRCHEMQVNGCKTVAETRWKTQAPTIDLAPHLQNEAKCQKKHKRSPFYSNASPLLKCGPLVEKHGDLHHLPKGCSDPVSMHICIF